MQGSGLRAQAFCSLEAGARLQGPLRRLQPLIRPPLAPKNNILVCLLGALRDRDRLFIPAISDAALLRPPPPRPEARPLCYDCCTLLEFRWRPRCRPGAQFLRFEAPSVLKQELRLWAGTRVSEVVYTIACNVF